MIFLTPEGKQMWIIKMSETWGCNVPTYVGPFAKRSEAVEWIEGYIEDEHEGQERGFDEMAFMLVKLEGPTEALDESTASGVAVE